MHPWILQQLAASREAELRRRLRHIHPDDALTVNRRRIRTRVGWIVVDFGLRLAMPRSVPDPLCTAADTSAR